MYCKVTLILHNSDFTPNEILGNDENTIRLVININSDKFENKKLTKWLSYLEIKITTFTQLLISDI